MLTSSSLLNKEKRKKRNPEVIGGEAMKSAK